MTPCHIISQYIKLVTIYFTDYCYTLSCNRTINQSVDYVNHNNYVITQSHQPLNTILNLTNLYSMQEHLTFCNCIMIPV